VEKLIPSEEFDAFYDDVELATVNFLPQRYVLDRAGLSVNVRSATKHDITRLYTLMKSAADSGKGYGIDEFPTLNAFRAMTAHEYVIVIEEEDSSKVRTVSDIEQLITTQRLIRFIIAVYSPAAAVVQTRRSL